ncbi:MAG: two-component sensor histidine kinase, partial [Brucellaceae bacterium]|nr:two-component sensor histidine kinase [Brucellaceae bacterium]
MNDDSQLQESMRNGDNRPSPDALLAKAEQETRGRLKVFLGAAPGVGKTYEMLMSGRSLLADGEDVVIGVVETHGRQETQALTEGYEIIPRARVDYKGHV